MTREAPDGAYERRVKDREKFAPGGPVRPGEGLSKQGCIVRDAGSPRNINNIVTGS